MGSGGIEVLPRGDPKAGTLSNVDRDEVLGLLRRERLAVKDSAFDAKAFGSWWIEVVTEPPIRLVWEGKDGWAIVQTARRGTDTGNDRWEDRWIGRGPDQDPVEAVRRVVECVHAAL